MKNVKSNTIHPIIEIIIAVAVLCTIVFTVVFLCKPSTVPKATEFAGSNFKTENYTSENEVLKFLVANSENIWSVTPTDDGYSIELCDAEDPIFMACEHGLDHMSTKQFMKMAVFIEDMSLSGTPVKTMSFEDDCVRFTTEYQSYEFKDWQIAYNAKFEQYSDGLKCGRYDISVGPIDHIRVISESGAIMYAQNKHSDRIPMTDEERLIKELDFDSLIEVEDFLKVWGYPHDKVSERIESLS